jgi:hypothetical protein
MLAARAAVAVAAANWIFAAPALSFSRNYDAALFFNPNRQRGRECERRH